MSDFISTLLQAVIIAAVPVCAAYIGKALKVLAGYIAAKSGNEVAREYLSEVSNAISTAVTYTSQVYVDKLRSQDKFDKDSQLLALETAVEKARSLLTAEAVAFLESAYGDLTAYLKTNIEAEVRNQKGGLVLLGGSVE